MTQESPGSREGDSELRDADSLAPTHASNPQGRAQPLS